MKKIKHHFRSGFSLVEMLISICLFGLIWASLIGSLVVGKTLEIRSRHRIQATYAAQRAIEALRKQAFIDIVNSEGTVTIDTQGTVSIGDDLTGTQTVTVIDMAPDLYKKIIVQIKWNEPLPVVGMVETKETLGTYIANDSEVN